MSILKKLYGILDKICEPVACLCLAGVILITAINVVLRYFFAAPLGYIEEVSALLYTFMVFFELSVTHKRNSVVAVDIVVSLLPQKAQKVIAVLSTFLTLFVWIILVVLGIKLAYTTRNTYTSYLHIPYHYIYWFFPISGFFCIVQLINRLVLLFTGQNRVEKLPAIDEL